MNKRMAYMPMALGATLLLLASTAMAQRSYQKHESRSSARTSLQSQRHSEQQQQVSGTVIRAKDVRIRRQGRDTGEYNRVILLQTQDGQRLVVDLGPKQNVEGMTIRQGTQLNAQGPVVRIGDRPVLLARQINTQGQTLQLQHPQRKQGQPAHQEQGQPAQQTQKQQIQQVSGQIKRLKEVEFRGTQQTNQVVLLQTDQGRQVIADLGSAQQIQKANLQQGMQIDVQGHVVRMGDRLILLANQVTADGQTYYITHPRQSQSQAAWQQQNQQQRQASSQEVHPQGVSKIHITSANDITGRTIRDQQGQDAGKVKYLMIDVQSGDVRYAIISSGGNLNIGQDLIAVPWSAVEMQQHTLQVPKSLEQLQQAPRFSEQRLSELTQPTVASLLYNYYLVPEDQTWQGSQSQQRLQGDESRQRMESNQGRQARQGNQGQQQAQGGQPHILVGRDVLTMLVPPVFMSSTEVSGTEVETAAGEVMGEIDKVMIDTDHGHVAYVLLTQEGFLGVKGQWTPVPYEVLQWSMTNQNFTLTLNEEQLQQMTQLPRQDLPTEVSAARLQQFYDHYGVMPYWDRIAMPASKSMQATVQEVDDQQGTVTLQMSTGRTVQLQVTEDTLTNLSEGDRVEVTIRPSDTTQSSSQRRMQQSQSKQAR